MRRTRVTPSTRRRAMALLTALVCLVVLAALALTLTRTVLARVREADLHAHQLQADALAESAIVRARSQWQSNAAWTGEVWQPEVEGAPKLHAELRVLDESPKQLQIACLVPANAVAPVRVERTVPWPPDSSSQVVSP